MGPWQLDKLASRTTKRCVSSPTSLSTYFNRSQVKKIHIPARENPIVNRLNKTKVEKSPNFQQEKLDREKELRQRELAQKRDKQKEEQRVMRERKEKAWQKDHAYDDLFTDEGVESNRLNDEEVRDLDDFM
jgi:hypothetical protein